MAKASASGTPTKAELAKIGRIQQPPDPYADASRWQASHRWLPWGVRWIQTMGLITVASVAFSAFSVTLRPRPTLLMAYPDGSTQCAPAPIAPRTRAPLPRASAREQALCQRLALEAGLTAEQRAAMPPPINAPGWSEATPMMPAVPPGARPVPPPVPVAPLPVAPEAVVPTVDPASLTPGATP